MADLAREAVAAGALGFTTSRTLNHRSSRGELTPTLTAEADELIGIAEALGSIGAGVLQVVSDFIDLDGEFETHAPDGRPVGPADLDLGGPEPVASRRLEGAPRPHGRRPPPTG